MPNPCAEPTIYDLLNDPLTQMVMRADRVDPRALRRMLGAIALNIGSTSRQGDDQSGWRDFPPAVRPGFGQWVRSQFCGAC